MPKTRHLTKSKFKLGLECPRKLFYANDKQYLNQSLEDSFLKSLANGGYQVGALAQQYYPDGVLVSTLDTEEALTQTATYLQRDNVVIFEAAIRFENLLVRIDILKKTDNHFEIIEVKAKSFNKEKDYFFNKKNGEIKSNWAPYLQDVAFQRYVLSKATNTASINSYLYLVDKQAVAATDGMNTKFIATEVNGRNQVTVSNTLCAADLKVPLVIRVPIDAELNYIQHQAYFGNRTFEQQIHYLTDLYIKNQSGTGVLNKTCKACEFRCSADDELQGFKNGFKYCWQQDFNLTEEDFQHGLAFDVWNFRGSDTAMANGKIRLLDLEQEDLLSKTNPNPESPTVKRQWLQIEKVRHNDASAWFDKEGLQVEMQKWTFPLHFIDFETSAPALPFTRGRKPYEQVAFQFSHHVVYEDGRVAHIGQYLDTEPGHFPNIDFVRALERELKEDSGTIFRYHNHENTILIKIFEQLQQDKNIDAAEKRDLIKFIKSITHSSDNYINPWRGDRNMVDLHRLVTSYYYNPYTKGSNSIKHVLPAVLQSSTFLQQKYSAPIYGAEGGIPSLNFSNWQWVQKHEGILVEPYKLLPKLFDIDTAQLDTMLFEDDSIADGGAALTAYSKLQFTQMTTQERIQLNTGLLKYCELDTLAMVMIYEAWRAELNL